MHRCISSCLGVAALSLAASAASAALIATETFPIGPGQYTAGTLQGQVVASTGMSSSGWTSGAGTAQPQVVAGGLGYAGFAPQGDRIDFNGTNTGSTRTLARNLATYTSQAASTYYISGLFHRNSVTTQVSDGYSLMGFANTVAPDKSTGSNSLAGLYIGYAMNSNTADFGDLVIRTRVTASSTTADTVLVDGSVNSTFDQVYAVVAKLQVNDFSGNQDTITYWVNPTDFSSEAAMTATALATNSFHSFAMGTTTDITRLELAQRDFDGNVDFDEPRFGNTLDAVVPEPASLGLIVMGAPLALRRRRA